jgi:hypothetical protein
MGIAERQKRNKRGARRLCAPRTPADPRLACSSSMYSLIALSSRSEARAPIHRRARSWRRHSSFQHATAIARTSATAALDSANRRRDVSFSIEALPVSDRPVYCTAREGSRDFLLLGQPQACCSYSRRVTGCPANPQHLSPCVKKFVSRWLLIARDLLAKRQCEFPHPKNRSSGFCRLADGQLPTPIRGPSSPFGNSSDGLTTENTPYRAPVIRTRLGWTQVTRYDTVRHKQA